MTEDSLSPMPRLAAATMGNGTDISSRASGKLGKTAGFVGRSFG